MAPARKTTKPTAAKQSKRKAQSATKSKKIKTKITRADTEQVSVPREVEEQQRRERVVTTRHKRMVQKARARLSGAPVEAPGESDVEAVRITDVAGVVYDPDEYQQMVDMYDATIKDIKEGEVVTGSVIGVSRDDVIVDVGFKSEGIIPMGEFTQPLNIKVGDEIEVYLEQIEDAHGQLILSKQKADFMRVWEKIREVHDSGEKITGKVARRIKGGLVVDIMGVDAFLPGSQVALRQVPDFDALIGDEMEVKIIKINKSRRNIVVSRRTVLEEEREHMRAQLLNEIAVGQIRQGIVKNITDFGVFIDLGGVDGLLHITDMSWGRIRHPSEMVSLGDKIDVKILDFDEKTSRISLGLKQMTPYPWENIEQKYPLGKKVKGRVVSITDYGAFVELEKGIEGLIHISEMSWTQHIKHPSKIMNVGDEVEAVVLSVDKDNEKISLGIKQMEPDPWTTIEQKYPVGKIVTGKVRNLTAFGAFVELEEGIDGLVHISDMSWTKRIQHPSEVMKKGDKVDVKILKIDHENRRISLGFKQLEDDPWAELAKKYGVGSECLGTVTRVMDRGVVVELDGSVEGFVPSTQLGRKNLTDPTGVFSEGDEIPLQVIEFDKNQHKIVLSVSAYYKKRERTELENFLATHPVSGSTEAPADEAAREHEPAPEPVERPRPRRTKPAADERDFRPARPEPAESTSAMADAMPEELKRAVAEAKEQASSDSAQSSSKEESSESEESTEEAEQKPE